MARVTRQGWGGGYMFDPVEVARDAHADCVPDQRTSQASQSASTPPIVATLVHGTFAKGAPWTKDGSILRQQIAAELGRQEKDVIFDVFEWSGRNTHKARIKAGCQLAHHIRKLKKRYPMAGHFIVAHSHGGNVALFAHKHLEDQQHVRGIATLGTPFIYADLPADLVSATDKSLRQMAREGALVRTLAMYLAVAAGLAVMMVLYSYYKPDEDTAALVSLAAGVLTWFLLRKRLTSLIVWLLHPISSRRSAMRLGQALALKAMPETHILSFVYPGDEAGLLLNTLEKTTALPTMAVRWFKEIAGTIGGVALVIFLATAFLSNPITYLTGISDQRLEDLATSTMSYVFAAGISIWFALVSIRYVLSFLRGHPGGFGWERPSIHAHVDIGVRPVARPPKAKSNLHQEVPFTAAQDAGKGLRHSGLYEDRRILKALAYWMAHVK